VPLYGDGRNVRDWIHVDDHCEAILAVLEHGRPGEVYNVGGSNECSNIDLTRAILKLVGRGEEWIERVVDRPGHDLRYAIDAGKIARECGWQPRRSRFPEALAETIRWYREHPTWWTAVKNGSYRDYYEKQYTGRADRRDE
jgi:dTDP-glucose 4,6-dehydratase